MKEFLQFNNQIIIKFAKLYKITQKSIDTTIFTKIRLNKNYMSLILSNLPISIRKGMVLRIDIDIAPTSKIDTENLPQENFTLR